MKISKVLELIHPFFVLVALVGLIVFGQGCVPMTEAKAVTWKDSWDGNVCTKSAGSEAYTLCLEQQAEIANRYPAPPPKVKLSETTESASSSVEPTPSATVQTETETKTTKKKVVLLDVEPKVSTKPVSPPTEIKQEKLKFASGGFIFAPMALGAVCELPPGMQKFELKLTNSTEDLLEVRGNLVPLNCDVGSKVVPARVLRSKTGKIEQTWVLQPGQTARYVFLPFNGGMGRVDVEVRAFTDFGEMHPALQTGRVRHTFEVPHPIGGHKNTWEIRSDLLSMRFSPMSLERFFLLAISSEASQELSVPWFRS